MVDNARVITVRWELLKEELERIRVEIKLHLAPIINVLSTSDKKLTSAEWIDASLTRVEACLDRTWERLNTGHWKDVPIENRYCYSLCTVTKAVLLELQCISNTESSSEEKKNIVFKDILDQIDKGILLGAPLPSELDTNCLLTSIAARLNRYLAEKSAVKLEEISVDYKGIDRMISYPNRHFEQPSMEEFNEKIFRVKLPAVLTGCMNHWKALTSWKDPNYLYRIMGFRTVPIEIGSSYTEEDWTQRLVSFSEFLQDYIITENNEIGYLAQHQLFEQVPELKEDFEVPLYCFFSDEPSEESTTHHVNSWLGPANTVSPLHYDRYNNLLCQVFGYKRVILYPPDETEYLYPHESRLLENTAQVDPLEPDYDKWPNFRKANRMTFYLKPGEMLYLPPKWWHHVTALTPSFSISFWWT